MTIQGILTPNFLTKQEILRGAVEFWNIVKGQGFLLNFYPKLLIA